MVTHKPSLVYPREKYRTILQTVAKNDEFFGLNELESKKLRIILAKYGRKHRFDTIPDYVTLELNRFYWNCAKFCFEINEYQNIRVKLNTLEEIVVEKIQDDYMQYLFW